MPTYAVGDIQGCAREFDQLLEAIGFGDDDELWLVGDLVNRGPDSIGVMQRVLELAQQTITVLGNHDLHLLAMYFAGHKPSRSDTVDDLLSHRRMPEFAEYLCAQPIFHTDQKLGWSMSHAGFPGIWSLSDALSLADEVALVLRDEHVEISRETFFRQMYGDEPNLWVSSLQGMDRVKLITNYFTRMRLVDANWTLDFSHKGLLRDL